VGFEAREAIFSDLWGVSESKYIVPRYQREYSWKVDNLVTFWSDLHDEEEFFFGSVVLKKPESRNTRIEIIDGQQRMLTMTMLYAAIRDVHDDIGAEDKGNHIHNTRIHKQTSLRGGYFIIQPTIGLKDYFERSVQSRNPDFNNPVTKEHKRVKRNYQWFKKKIKELLVHDSLEANLDVLADLDDQIRNMQIIRILVDDSYDAYRIFETVNATGVDLSVADLLKNMIFRNVSEDEDSGEDPALIKWESMKKNLKECDIEVAKFVRYHWISSRETVTMGNLYKSVKGATTTRGWEDLLDNLHSDSKLLNVLRNGSIPNPNSLVAIGRVNDKLKAINELGFSQCYVLLLSIFRNRERLDYSWESFLKMVSEIENFNFTYHMICRHPANRVEAFYSRRAIKIDKIRNDSDSLARFNSNIERIYNELNHIRPRRQEFIENFKERTMYTNSTKKKKLIRYILGRVEEFSYPDEFAERPIDNSISIEHILPQSPEQFWGLTEDVVLPYVHSIGNLVLVGIGFNSSARNFELERKIVELRETAIRTTADLLSEIESQDSLLWDREKIETRTTKLAESAYDELWSNR
jgi:hypothetical protein